LNTDLWKVLVAVIVLLALWARGEREEWQWSDAACQSGVLPGRAEAAFAPALVETRVNADCEPAGEALLWTSAFPWATAFVRRSSTN
jgi:hypothetical protein